MEHKQNPHDNLRENPFIKTKALSEKLAIPVYTLTKMVRMGVIPAYQPMGKDYFFIKTEVIKALKQTRVN